LRDIFELLLAQLYFFYSFLFIPFLFIPMTNIREQVMELLLTTSYMLLFSIDWFIILELNELWTLIFWVEEATTKVHSSIKTMAWDDVAPVNCRLAVNIERKDNLNVIIPLAVGDEKIIACVGPTIKSLNKQIHKEATAKEMHG
ncbi:hypothetical protein ACJX0J_025909, partial [Zea mays]